MTELLVVLAIILILAALLFPALLMVRAKALQISCQSNFKQAQLATMLYVADYDDRLMPTNHQPTNKNSRSDRTWVQLILPYITNFSVFKCPGDYGIRPKPEATFDQDLVPGDTTSRYYQASLRSNIGYNYLYLAPIVLEQSGWQVEPRSWSQVASPPQSLLFVDTVYEVKDGIPSGGGSYLVIPPCRYQIDRNSQKIDSFFSVSVGGGNQPKTVLTDHYGWDGGPNSTYTFGGAWPWHLGHMTITKLDGSAMSITPEQLAAGCEAKGAWTGLIDDPSHYIWHIDDSGSY